MSESTGIKCSRFKCLSMQFICFSLGKENTKFVFIEVTCFLVNINLKTAKIRVKTESKVI